MLENKYRKSIVSIFLVVLFLFSSCLSVFADNTNSTDGNNVLQTDVKEKADRIINLVVGQSYTFVFDDEVITNCITEDSGIVGAIQSGSIYGTDYGSTTVIITTDCSKYTYTVNVIKKDLEDSAIFFYPTDTHKIIFNNVFPEGTEENQGLFPEPDYKFVSENTNVATVSENGIITACSVGKTTVMIEFGAKSNTLTYDVFVEEPTLKTTSATINNAGGKIKIEVNCGLNQKVTYRSNNSSVATVDKKGNVTGLKKGTTYITVKVDSTVLNFKVNVKKSPKLNILKRTIYTSNTFTLKAIGAVEKVKYISSNKKVATVNNKGIVKGVGKGTCIISVFVNGMVLKCTVTVKKPLLNVTTRSIYIKSHFVIKVKQGLFGKAKYKSNNKNIATVNSKGMVTGIKKGTTNIIVTANGIKLKCKINVKNPKLNYTNKKITEGKSFRVKVTGGKGKISFKSNNKKIATVSKYGNVKVKKAGTCKIIVRRNGIKLVCKVTVCKSKFPVGYSLKIKQKCKSFKRHQHDIFNITSYFKKTDNAKKLYKQKKCTKKQYKYVNTQHLFKFKSSNTKIASIFPNGKIVAKNKGTCTITVTLYNGKKYIYTLTVLNPLTEKTLKNGKKVKYVYSYNDLLKNLYDDAKKYNTKGINNPYYGYACVYNNNYDLSKGIYDDYIPSSAKKINKDFKNKYKTGYYNFDEAIERIEFNKEINYKICRTPNYYFYPIHRKYYTAAMSILKKLNLGQYKSNNDKVVAIFNYLATNIKYGYTDSISDYGNLLDTLISGQGVCANNATCADYLCALSNIECHYVESDIANHAMNVVQADNGKYYFCDCTANGFGTAMWTGTRQLRAGNGGWKEFTDFALRNFGISVSPRSFPYLDDEDKKYYDEIDAEFLECYFGYSEIDNKWYDYRYFCDKDILKSLGITPVD